MASLSVSSATHKLLKNFAGVSSSVILKSGTTQKIVAEGKTLLAVAEFPEPWPQETAIYNMATFMQTLSLFGKPEIIFEDEAMVIFQGNSRVRYRYSDPSVIMPPPSKNLNVANPSVEFKLSADMLARINKTTNVLDLEMVTFKVEGGKVVVKASNPDNPASNAFEYEVPAEDVTFHDPSFEKEHKYHKAHLAMLMDGDYTVAFSNWNFGYFKHAAEPICYFIVSQA